jgi:hypothetical protein
VGLRVNTTFSTAFLVSASAAATHDAFFPALQIANFIFGNNTPQAALTGPGGSSSSSEKIPMTSPVRMEMVSNMFCHSTHIVGRWWACTAKAWLLYYLLPSCALTGHSCTAAAQNPSAITCLDYYHVVP